MANWRQNKGVDMISEQYFEDEDRDETDEWLDALESVIRTEGVDRARYLLKRLLDTAHDSGITFSRITTPYLNTIAPKDEPPLPGDLFMERRIRSLIRWNALAMVIRANQDDDELGGHIASFASSATLYDIGFNHFFRAPHGDFGGDLLYIQGHSAPGIYARAYLEGRLTEKQLNNFRREVDGEGLSSYPHPWLMPEFWQFPTVSMGLGPIQAIYQTHVMKYLHNRGLIEAEDRKVWAFLGDGEMDEPESLGAISLAGREKLDNLIFVVNCNLQRLDGPVRGNGKIIQELEGVFRGAGWNVIKVVWGRLWDPLLEQDETGLLRKRMEEVVDGEYQTYKNRGGAYTREKFFGKYPELLKLVEHLSNDEIFGLNRGGHDPYKVFAAYQQAVQSNGKPTVILAKTVKGYGLGEGEASNKTHSIKKLALDSLKGFRDRYNMPFSDDELTSLPFYKPQEDSPEIRYLLEKRQALGGFLPARNNVKPCLEVPSLEMFKTHLDGSGGREISTTMALVRMLSSLTKDKTIGERVVPIVPDEARTFGMEGMFRQLGIYSTEGQLYEPEDASQVMFYREDKKGRILEEGINEAGAFSAWMAAATSYSNHDCPMIPCYIFYSMFGFQRIGDLAWAAGDLQARGFLIGATSGRTTLNGEGLQHQDGHSHVLAGTIPNCICYDPTYAYELAVIMHDGLRRMWKEGENVFYYITTLNENYVHPPMPDGAEEGIVKGMYCLKGPSCGDQSGVESSSSNASDGDRLHVQLLGSGAILREVLAAEEILAEKYSITADVWSVTSFVQLRKESTAVQRWNMLHPEQTTKTSYLDQCLNKSEGPVVVATDYVRSHGDQIRPFIRKHFTCLGTDGYGRSDSRKKLRHFFEVDRYFVVVAALKALADQEKIEPSVVSDAIREFNINPEKPDPASH